MAAQTKAERTRDAIWARLDELSEQRLHRARNRAKGPLVARMDEVQECGAYDRDENGFNRMYRGGVADKSGTPEPMQAQVVTLGGDMVVCFWSAVRDHHRRFIVMGNGGGTPTYWMETDARAVQCGPQNKYYDAIKRIVCLHLHYSDVVSLTPQGEAATSDSTGEAA